jgi:hypothetical protein
MALKQETDAVREAVGIFNTSETFQAAIDELMSSGFDRAELSLLAAKKAVEEKFGHKYKKVAELEDDPAARRTSHVSLESGGTLAAAIAGVALATDFLV